MTSAIWARSFIKRDLRRAAPPCPISGIVGGGHSAINVALALTELQQPDPETEVFWALRHNGVELLLGGASNDQLPPSC
ncbi:hypothetical protein N184_22590 [Sinorhizobium sp. GL28]|nr:hypothetical protein N184_22590 [Sinorhizobium sp. GL28]